MNKSTRLTFIIGFLAFCLGTNAQPYLFNWVKAPAGAATDAFGRSVGVDSQGNVYSAGSYSGTIDFDPGPGTFTLTSNPGDYDVFVVKLNSSGNFIWARSMGGASWEYVNSIRIDQNDNILMTGQFYQTADFDPGVGTTTLVSNGLTDVFVVKLNSSGNLVWAKSFGGTDDEMGYGITTDASGNVYTTGYAEGVVDYDPGAGTFTATIGGGQDGDLFLQKLDASGNFVFASVMGGPLNEYGNDVEVDASGNIYLGGFFDGVSDFDPTAGVTTLTGVTGDAFVAKYTNTGNLTWVRAVGGAGADGVFALAIDLAGNVYSTGFYNGTADLDPGVGVSTFTSNGSDDTFILSLSSTGNFNWVNSIGGSGEDYAYSISLTNNSDIFIGGYFNGTVDFDPGPGTTTLASNGAEDVFLSKLSTSGNLFWAVSFGGIQTEKAFGVIASGSALYSTGYYSSVCDFDPGVATTSLTPLTAADIFIHKMSPFPEGMKEVNKANNLKVFPNPTSSFLKLDMKEIESATITNIVGEEVFYSENTNDKIDVSSFANGIYFIMIQSQNEFYSAKFVKE